MDGCPSSALAMKLKRTFRVHALRGGGEGKPVESQLQDLMDLFVAKADQILEPRAPDALSSLTSNMSTQSSSSVPARRHYTDIMHVASEQLNGIMDDIESRFERLRNWTTVKFRRYAKVQHGQALYVCGDSPQLGDGDPSKAIRLTHQGGDLWEGVVSSVREGAKYRYVIMAHHRGSHGSGDGEVQWLTTYPLHLTPELKNCLVENGMLVVDNTYQSVRFKVSRDGVSQVRSP